MSTQPRLIETLLRNFAFASLSDKVVIAGVVYVAMGGKLTEEMREKLAAAWKTAVTLEITLEKIRELYAKGLADYTRMLDEYAPIVEFISDVLGGAISGQRYSQSSGE